MAPTEKSTVQMLQDKMSEASVTVLDLTKDSFRLLIKGDRILTRVRGSILPTITAPILLFAVYASFFAAIQSSELRVPMPGFEYKDLVPYLPQDFVQSFDGATPQIAPLEIIKLFHQYIGMFEREGKLDGRTIGVLLSGANTFTDQLSNAERILTPWPLAYSIHLKQIITLYCLALPPQLAPGLGWWVVPVTSAAVFTFFGMEAIALEISNPCGYDLNDLPVDQYCAQLKAELAGMMQPSYRPKMKTHSQ
ncbi:unnamed protein product [Umbelopsis vinacea]